MNGTLMFVYVTKTKEGMQLGSYAVYDMINLERLGKSKANPAWERFYEACCNYRVGSIICNCSSNLLRKLFVENNLAFSDKKSVLNYFTFIQVPKLVGLSVRDFIVINSMSTERNPYIHYDGLNFASAMADCARFWCEHKLVGVDILKETMDNLYQFGTALDIPIRERYVTLLSKIDEIYPIGFNEEKVPQPIDMNLRYRLMYLWFDTPDDKNPSKVIVTINGRNRTKILFEKDNPSIQDIQQIFISYSVKRVITNIRGCYDYIRDNITVVNHEVDIIPWIGFFDSFKSDISYGSVWLDIPGLALNCLGDKYWYNLLTIDEFFKARNNNQSKAYLKLIGAYIYVAGLYTINAGTVGIDKVNEYYELINRLLKVRILYDFIDLGNLHKKLLESKSYQDIYNTIGAATKELANMYGWDV